MNEHEQQVLIQIIEEMLKWQSDERPQFTKAALAGIAKIKRGIADRKNFEETH